MIHYYYEDQNIGQKRTTIRTRPFSSFMVDLKRFSPKCKHITSKDQEHPNMTSQGHTKSMNEQTLILIVGDFSFLPSIFL